MKKFARIERDAVREVIEIADDMNIADMFHASLAWLPAPPGCAEGWPVFNGAIVAPDYYQVQRQAAYPDIAEFVDGMVKVHSADPDISAAGDAQIAAYCEACLAVKAQFPKPPTGGL